MPAPIAIRCHAPNTPSGNPRRIALVISAEHGTPIEAIELGFRSVRELCPDAVEGMGINISVSEYKRILSVWEIPSAWANRKG